MIQKINRRCKKKTMSATILFITSLQSHRKWLIERVEAKKLVIFNYEISCADILLFKIISHRLLETSREKLKTTPIICTSKINTTSYIKYMYLPMTFGRKC